MMRRNKVASGVLPIARSTKRMCIAWRSPEIRQGDCWGLIGGMVDPGYTIETGALAEMGQEVGFYGPIELHHAFVHSRPGFSYHSFVGLVLEEFSFLPEPDYAYETSFIGWFDHSTIVRMVLEQPETFHPGFLEMWAASQDVIKTVIEAQVQ